jgi:hypothetical protein
MLKTITSAVVALTATGLLWLWTATQFRANQHDFAARVAYVQTHQNDALHSILCYLERRTLVSKTVPIDQKVQSVHTLDQVLRVGNLRPCGNLPHIPKG